MRDEARSMAWFRRHTAWSSARAGGSGSGGSLTRGLRAEGQEPREELVDRALIPHEPRRGRGAGPAYADREQPTGLVEHEHVLIRDVVADVERGVGVRRGARADQRVSLVRRAGGQGIDHELARHDPQRHRRGAHRREDRRARGPSAPRRAVVQRQREPLVFEVDPGRARQRRGEVRRRQGHVAGEGAVVVPIHPVVAHDLGHRGVAEPRAHVALRPPGDHRDGVAGAEALEQAAGARAHRRPVAIGDDGRQGAVEVEREQRP
ncbi:MAG: hypothetical protein U0325_18245 [Polyangiales bacterium]